MLPRLTILSTLACLAACGPRGNDGGMTAAGGMAGSTLPNAATTMPTMQEQSPSGHELRSGPTGLLAGFYPKTSAWSPLQHANRGSGLLSIAPQFKAPSTGARVLPPTMQPGVEPATPLPPILPGDTTARARVGGDSVPVPNPHRDSVPVKYNRADTTKTGR